MPVGDIVTEQTNNLRLETHYSFAFIPTWGGSRCAMGVIDTAALGV